MFGTTVRKCLNSFHFLLTNDVFCDSVSEEQKTKSKIQLLFSYSEWWRYIGSVKPRQPPADWSAWEGASLSEIFEQ